MSEPVILEGKEFMVLTIDANSRYPATETIRNRMLKAQWLTSTEPMITITNTTAVMVRRIKLFTFEFIDYLGCVECLLYRYIKLYFANEV